MIFFAFFDKTKQDHKLFLQHLNTKHDNLTFTSEVGVKGLPFLDVNVSTLNDSFYFSVFRKKTYTGLLLNFHSFCPIEWKKAIILCFLSRAFTICSSWSAFSAEVSQLRSFFVQNSYPPSFFDTITRRFVNGKHTTSARRKDEADKKEIQTIVLPYFGSVSERFKTRFSRLCKQHNIDCKVVFTPFKILRYFSLKTRVPDFLQSSVVYKYTCSVDPMHFSYVGRPSDTC